MTPLSPTRQLRVLFGALRTAVPCRPIDPFFQLLQPQSLRHFVAVVNFRAHRVMSRALQQFRHGLMPLLPTIEFA
jgi:hypothetical protein